MKEILTDLCHISIFGIHMSYVKTHTRVYYVLSSPSTHKVNILINTRRPSMDQTLFWSDQKNICDILGQMYLILKAAPYNHYLICIESWLEAIKFKPKENWS